MLTIWKNFSYQIVVPKQCLYNPSCIDFVIRFWLIPWLLLMFFFLIIVLVSRNSGICVNVRSSKNCCLALIIVLKLCGQFLSLD